MNPQILHVCKLLHRRRRLELDCLLTRLCVLFSGVLSGKSMPVCGSFASQLSEIPAHVVLSPSLCAVSTILLEHILVRHLSNLTSERFLFFVFLINPIT